MSLFITSLNSGSNGNCYYIGNDTEAVLIDAGISCRETEKRMQHLALSMEKVKAVFISHEHIDHIKGLPVLSEKYNLPVYITDITLKHSRININGQRSKTFKAYEPVQIGNLFITAFPKNHDAEDPHSFIITCNDITVGVFTDIGSACTHVTSQFRKCDAAFLEANYDEVLLENGQYPWHLKNRIRGGKGHLSNKQALEIFVKHRPACMTHLLLAHLSRDNNNPDIAKKLFEEQATNTTIIVASRYEQTPVYTIVKNDQPLPVVRQRKAAFKLMQLSLFEEVNGE
jgi:phosphoribosyl 1,2-cyclic phosphodiesterase